MLLADCVIFFTQSVHHN